jgi:hypothetical protein
VGGQLAEQAQPPAVFGRARPSADFGDIDIDVMDAGARGESGAEGRRTGMMIVGRRLWGAERRRRPLFALGLALNAAVISMPMSTFGATPAPSLQPLIVQEGTNDVRENDWVPLACDIIVGGTGVSIPVHIAEVLNVTRPDSVDPGQTFDLTNTTALHVWPSAAQHAVLPIYHSDKVAGTESDIELHGVNVTSNFTPGSAGSPNKVQVNLVAALQPPNSDSPSPVDPLINPTAGNPAPGPWWDDNGIPASDGRRQGVFTFGSIPTPGGQDPNSSADASGPSPGIDGTPDPLHIFPLQATGAAGTNIAISLGQPPDAPNGLTGTTVTVSGTTEVFAANALVFFHQTQPQTTWSTPTPMSCGLDTFPPGPGSANSVPVPAPGFCTRRPSVAEPQGFPVGCYTSDDSTSPSPAPASARPGIQIPIVTPAPRVEMAQGGGNYFSLASSNGATWQDMVSSDCASPFTSLTCPRVQVAPTVSQSVALRGNADLFTDTAGYNQDIGIFVSDNGGADTLLTWKESGGFAGTFSPNAAYVQALYNMTGGHTYVFKLKWKTNKNAPGVTIYASAGGGTSFPGRSDTSLAAETFPAAGTQPILVTQNTGNFDSLLSSNGTTWQPMDAALTTTLNPSANSTALLGANADLFTDTSGYNQDIGLFVSVDGTTPTLVAWKESGGFAGTYSPNAAYVKEIYPMTGGHTYNFSLYWKTNKNAPGVTIYASAGNGTSFPGRSPTSLLAETIAAGANPYSAVKTNFSSLANSDGTTWQLVDPALNVTVPGSDNTNALLGANVDLYTGNIGYNQDIGIFVSDNGGADTLVAWKESGGFGGTYSPNAAYVQSTLPLASGHTYVFKLKWKTNINAPGATIYAGAGAGAPFSPTRLVAEITR